jgi:hypothetical protein
MHIKITFLGLLFDLEDEGNMFLQNVKLPLSYSVTIQKTTLSYEHVRKLSVM